MAPQLHVLQTSAWYPPGSCGGTEVYLEGLVGELFARGVRCDVAIPWSDDLPVRYHHQGAVVRTYLPQRPARSGYGEGAQATSLRPLPKGNEDFSTLLCHTKRHSPKVIYHQHAWTPDCGAWHLREARRLGMPTVLTVHVPSLVCMRGTMLRDGEAVCDGRLEVRRCVACFARAQGASSAVAEALSRVPETWSKCARHWQGRAGTALSLVRQVAGKRAALRDAVAHADRVVVPCRWLYGAMRRNKVSDEKLILSRQGVASELASWARAVPPGHRAETGAGDALEPATLRALYVGRFDPMKGVEVAVRAMRQLRHQTNISLTIHALSNTSEEDKYKSYIRGLAGDDRRIQIKVPLGRKCLARSMASFDVLLVPSLLLETGPLVVLEAQASGLFIVGTDVGGIAELVTDADDGILVPPGDAQALARALDYCLQQKINGTLPCRIRQVRTMSDVADDMARLYQELADHGCNAHAPSWAVEPARTPAALGS